MNKFNFQTKKPHWLLFPLASGLLMALSFYPFGASLLIFVAFAPLIYFAIGIPERTARELFIGGFIAGSISALSFSYPFFGQFHWVKETYLFETIIRLFFIPATIIGGLAAGTITVITRFLITKWPVFNALIFSTLFALWLLVFQLLIDGFNYFDPAFAATSIPILVKFAGIGGTPFVTFIILLINSFFALLFLAENKKKFLLGVIGVVAIFNFGLLAHERYLTDGERGIDTKTVSIAIIQISDRKDEAFGFIKDDSFQYPLLEKRVKEAISKGAELVIYPFSPVSGAIAINGIDAAFNKKVLVTDINTFGAWVKKNVPENTIFLTWNSIYEKGSFFNEYSFWKNGELYKRYQKRQPLPFADYTPSWAAKKGFYTTPFDVKTSSISDSVLLGDYSVGNLICSEVGDRELARGDARTTSFIIAGGSDAMFTGDVAGRINLINAQYRAAENNIPVIRANRLGPSAIISPDGSIMSRIEYNKDGVLSGKISISERKETFYSKFGDTPLLAIFLLVVIISVVSKIKIRTVQCAK